MEIVRTEGANLLALHLSNLFDVYNIETVIDVGGRIGEYGTWLRLNGYRGRIVSFEPVAANFDLLAQRAQADGNWAVHRLALGSAPGSQTINVTNLSSFSSFLEPTPYSSETFGADPEVQRKEVVEIARLDDVADDLVAEDSGALYLKLDTQGWDLEVLDGASSFLVRVTALQTEVSVQPIYEGCPDWRTSLEYLKKAGFSVSGLFPVNLDRDLRVVEFDCVAVRNEAATQNRRP